MELRSSRSPAATPERVECRASESLALRAPTDHHADQDGAPPEWWAWHAWLGNSY